MTLTPNDGGSGVNVTEYSVDGNPTYTVGTSVVIPAPARRLERRRAHDRLLLRRQRRQHRDDQEHDRADRRDAAGLPVLLCRRLPPRHRHAERKPERERVRHPVGRVRVHGRRRLDVDDDRHRQRPVPRPYTVDWDTVAGARRPLRPAHSDHGQRRQRDNDEPARQGRRQHGARRRPRRRAHRGPARLGHDRDRRVGFRRHFAGRLGQVLRPRLALRHRHDRTVLLELEHDHGRRRRRDDPGRRRGHGRQHRDIVAVRNVSVDNVSPTPTLADPGQYLSGTVSLSASSDARYDAGRLRTARGGRRLLGHDRQRHDDAVGDVLDTTALADGLYDFRVVATEPAGHSGTSPIRANVRIDNTDTDRLAARLPRTAPPSAARALRSSGSYSDAGSGVASVRYELRPTGGGSWSTIATATGAPFSATWDATTVSSGSYDLQPVITDARGQHIRPVRCARSRRRQRADRRAHQSGRHDLRLVTLNATVTGSGANAGRVQLELRPAAPPGRRSGPTRAPRGAPAFDTTQAADGLYDLRAAVSDDLGNTSERRRHRRSASTTPRRASSPRRRPKARPCRRRALDRPRHERARDARSA